MAKPTGPHTIHLVPTSHWDREWYLPLERFRAWLVDALDDVLDLLDRFPSYSFTLDGQSILLEDYLALRQEQKGRVSRHVASGRLVTGPWYVQPDEFLVSGESLVRNLAHGMELAREMGGAMSCGYLPDSFGHVADLPEVLAGFGIGTAVFARGAGDDLPPMKEIFWWSSPGGERVLAHLYPIGYGPAAGLSRDTSLAAGQLDQVKAKLARLCASNQLLLPAGSDHSRPQPQVPGAVDLLNRPEEGDCWLISSHEAYFAALEEDVIEAQPTHTGELRGARDAPLLSGTLSARLYLKQRNFQLETLLTRHVEPAVLMARRSGMSNQGALLGRAWRLLLQNHPHDSICGCSVDAVHDEMETRFAKVAQLAEHLLERAVEHLGRSTHQPPSDGPALGKLLLLSCDAQPGAAQVEADLLLSRAELKLALEPAKEEHLCIGVGEEARPLQIISHSTRYEGLMGGALEDLAQWLEQLADRHPVRDYSCGLEGPLLRISVDEGPASEDATGLNEEALKLAQDPGLERVEIHLYRSRLRVAAALDGGPSLGYRCHALQTRRMTGLWEACAAAGPDWLENDHLRVSMAEEGLELEHKTMGWRLSGQHQLIDVADGGDTYNFNPLPGDGPLRAQLVHWEVTERGPVRATLRLRYRIEIPARLAEDRLARSGELVQHEIITDVSLWRDCPRVDFHTRFDNRARDHRLRIGFPLPMATDHVYADSAFSVVRRQREPPLGEGWPEQQVDAHPLRTFVDLSDDRRGAALIASGLAEYGCSSEAPHGGLALTLVRSVGMLARDDLKVRPGLAGPPYETPGAQCQGEQSFRYALMLHPGDWANAGVAAQARAFCGPPLLALCPDGELSQNEGPCGDSLGSLPQGYWTSALMADSGGRAICRAVNGSDIPLSPPEGETIDLSGAATSVPAMVAAGGLVTTVLDTKEG